MAMIKMLNWDYQTNGEKTVYITIHVSEILGATTKYLGAILNRRPEFLEPWFDTSYRFHWYIAWRTLFLLVKLFQQDWRC
jgi:predicted ferric reductase